MFGTKQFNKDFLFAVLNVFSSRLGDKASILMYHSIGDSGCFFTVMPGEFERQMRYLKKEKLNIIPLSELVSRIDDGRSIAGCVAITFDDGYRDNYEVAFPILKKYGLPATIFIATDFVGGKSENSEGIVFEMLTENMIREMEEGGLIQFMPHTKSHRVLSGLSGDAMREEIMGSRAFIEKITGKKADIFSYPKGTYTREVMSYLKSGEWRGAVIVEEGSISTGDDPFLLRRNSVDSSTSPVQFKGKLSRAIDSYNTIKKWFQ